MPVPISKWSAEDWTNDRIGRFFARQNYRLAAGLALSRGFRHLRGSLCIVQGRGKYLRLKHVESAETRLPAALVRDCRQLLGQMNPDGARLVGLGSDLAEHQAGIIDQLLRRAGKYVDRVLTVTLDSHGAWFEEFDGRLNWVTPHRAQWLAEKTGVNVIDAIRDRDLEAGGNGEFLEALPVWLMHMNREQPLDDAWSVVVHVGDHVRGYLLPPTDGLDEVLPAIKAFSMELPISGSPSATALSSGQSLAVSDDTDDSDNALSEKPTVTSILAQTADWLAKEQNQFRLPIREIRFVGEPAGLVEELSARWNAESPLGIPGSQTRLAYPLEAFDAVVAAMWGVLFVDQMPGNLPSLTGAKGQRILGRLTPGKPMTWRNLLVNMNDGDAPIMKLKDAI